MNILAWTGYWVGLGIELGIIVIAGVLLALMLTGVLFNWIASVKAWNERRKEENERKKAEKAARAEAEAAARAQAEAERAEEAARKEAERAEAEAAAALAEEEAEATEEAEEETAEAEAVEEAAEETKAEDEALLAEDEEEEKPKKKKKPAKKKTEEDGEDEEEAEGKDTEVVVVQEGIVFNDSKTITELYDELSAEQKSFFDELREEALTKPDAELAMAKNFITVKIGKRNLIKLLIKRGVTVAEFMLENEALKQLRLSNTNKRGKSTIKVKPTVVQVLDVTSLKVAVDMINLAYEELMLND